LIFDLGASQGGSRLALNAAGCGNAPHAAFISVKAMDGVNAREFSFGSRAPFSRCTRRVRSPSDSAKTAAAQRNRRSGPI